MNTAISSPRPVSTARPTLASPLWWRPWSVPPAVDQAIRDSFQTGQTPQEMLGSAARLLLDWRTGQIPRNGDREVAKFWVREAFEGGNFDERPKLVSMLGTVYGDEGDVWINPVLDEPDLFVARYGVMAHELGGHLAGFKGASGAVWKQLESYGGFWVRWLDPLSLVTCPFAAWISENGGLGAEWELAHRIPFELRLDWMEAIRNSLGEHAPLLSLESYLEKRKYRRRYIGDDVSRIERLFGLYLGYHLLVNANLPKGRYIRNISDLRFSRLGAMLVREAFLVDKTQRKRMLTFKAFEVLKLGAAIAAGVAIV